MRNEQSSDSTSTKLFSQKNPLIEFSSPITILDLIKIYKNKTFPIKEKKSVSQEMMHRIVTQNIGYRAGGEFPRKHVDSLPGGFSVRVGGHAALFWYWSPDTTPSKHSNGKGRGFCALHGARVSNDFSGTEVYLRAMYSYSRLRTRITSTPPGHRVICRNCGKG